MPHPKKWFPLGVSFPFRLVLTLILALTPASPPPTPVSPAAPRALL